MTIEPDNAGRMQGGQFAPGCSGNPAGMKLGTRHRTARLVQRMMSGDAEDVVKAVVAAAKGGDMTAARLVLDRIAPPCRGRRVRLALPPIVGAADLVKAHTNRFSGIIVNEKISPTGCGCSVFETSNPAHSMTMTVLISTMAS